jgi:hypothetical protein
MKVLLGFPHCKPIWTMLHHTLRVARGFCAAMSFCAILAVLTLPAAAQTPDGKAVDKAAGPAQKPAAQPTDEYSSIQREVSGPAGNPECVWLGRRVVSLLWRDDIDTAFRHLDLYDRFGCPAGHIQATFRCLILHESSIDPKAPDSLNGRVEACWINPYQPAPPPPAAATAAPAKETTNR